MLYYRAALLRCTSIAAGYIPPCLDWAALLRCWCVAAGYIPLYVGMAMGNLMREQPIMLPANHDASAVEASVDAALAAFGLSITVKDTLKQYPGCTHWHAKRGKQAGILEATYWPAQQRLWLSVHHNRSAAWIEAIIEPLRADIEQRIQ
jgi:hypothetical protein